MKREVLLVVDMSNQVYKSTAAHQGLTSGRTFTGGLYGFLVGLSKTIEDTGADRVIVGCDSRPYVRSLEYPDYKGNRKNKEKTEQDELMLMAFKQSMSLVGDLCRTLNIPMWSVPGYEYDDLVAYAALRYGHQFETVVAMSNDSDLFQLLWLENFYVHRGKIGTFRLREFLAEWGGIRPQDLPIALAMTGTHNALDGIYGIGPKTAIKTLQDAKRWEAVYGEHEGLIKRNLGLIVLPHETFPFDTPLPEKETLRDPARALTRFCVPYDIQVTRSMNQAFDQILKG